MFSCELEKLSSKIDELDVQIKRTTDPAMTTLLLEKEVALLQKEAAMRKVQAAMLQKEVLLMQGEQA